MAIRAWREKMMKTGKEDQDPLTTNPSTDVELGPLSSSEQDSTQPLESTSLEEQLDEEDADDAVTAATRANESVADKHHRALIVGLLKGRRIWRGHGCCDTLRDLWFYICQVHPLLCVFLAHPQHPFKRTERALHLSAMLMLAVFIAAMTETRYAHLTFEDEAKQTWLVVSNVALVGADALMKELATCRSIQPGGIFEVCGKCCGLAACCVSCGAFALKICVIVTLVLSLVGVGLLLQAGSDSVSFAGFFAVFAIMKLAAYASNLVIGCVMFYGGRMLERKTWWHGKRSYKAPFGPSLPSRQYLVHSSGPSYWARCCAHCGRSSLGCCKEGAPPSAVEIAAALVERKVELLSPEAAQAKWEAEHELLLLKIQTKQEQRDECMAEFCPCHGACKWFCCGDHDDDFESYKRNSAVKSKADPAAAVGFAAPPAPRARGGTVPPSNTKGGGTRGQGTAAKSLAERMRQNGAQREAYREKHYGR